MGSTKKTEHCGNKVHALQPSVLECRAYNVQWLWQALEVHPRGMPFDHKHASFKPTGACEPMIETGDGRRRKRTEYRTEWRNGRVCAR